MNKYIWIIAFLTLILTMSCESMEETYEEYWGDGPIRYVGKCVDFVVEPGWERFRFSWKNSLDGTTDKVKIKWMNGNEHDSVIIDGTQNTYISDYPFRDVTYTFNITALDKDGNESLANTAYARAFTENHEVIRSFDRLEEKYFFVNNNLVLFLYDYNENLKNAKITYFLQDGNQKVWTLTEADFEKKYHIVKDVDISKPVVVSRKAMLEGCFDMIVFKDYQLERHLYNISSDMALQLGMTYNLLEIDNEFIEKTEVLNLSYSLNSLEDVLYFQNLKKLVLGGERYMHPTYKNSVLSELFFDPAGSIFALKTIHELLGVELEIYNDQYGLLSQLPFAKNMGNPELPNLNYLNNISWTVNCTTQESGDNSHPEYLLDNEVNTVWRPLTEQNIIREHIVKYDMKEEKTIRGFKLTQPIDQSIAQVYLPDVFEIQVSSDGNDWKECMLRSTRIVGNGYGESTVIYLPQEVKARYVRFILNDKVSNRKCTYLADFMIF